MKHCMITGIIGRRGGCGFSVIFSTAKDAQKYKDMFKWIIQDDNFKVDIKRGYYDSKKD